MVAKEVRAVLLAAVDRHERRLQLDDARAERAERLVKIASREHEPAGTPAENRALLAEVFQLQPQVAEMLTAHFRDLRALPDEDVASCLRQLSELGVLDKLGLRDEES